MNETTEYYIERIADFNFQLGKIAGINEICQLVKSRSGEYFINKQDDLASVFRSLSEAISSRATAKEKEMEKENLRKKYSEYWQLLEQTIQNEEYPADKK